MSAARKSPERPGLPSNREPIVVAGLPGASAIPTVPPPAPYPGVRGYGSTPTPSRGSGAKRADPPGMSRESYYITQEAADAIAAAVDQIRDALGEKDKPEKDRTPKQVILSALLLAGAERAGEVRTRIAAQQADELAARLEALRSAAG
jgi:hypothetical protein